MIKKHEMIAAFYTGLEEFLFNHNETKALIEVLKEYVDTLNYYIKDKLYSPTNDEYSAVSVKYTCSENNDDIIILAHNGSESVTLATIKRDNTGAFKEFRHIGSDDGITVTENNVDVLEEPPLSLEDIERALLRMLETPALTSALYRLICQSGWPTFNDLEDDKYEAMITRGSKAIKAAQSNIKTDSEIIETLNQFCEDLNNEHSFYKHKIEFSDDAPFELSIIREAPNEEPNEKPKKETLIELKTQYGTYPVNLKTENIISMTVDNQDQLKTMIEFI